MIFNYVTPEEYFNIQQTSPKTQNAHTLEELKRMSKNKGKCEVCGEPVWKLGDCGLCFTCTTGESDSSYDYELI
jgi:hypothetical protein